MYLIEAYGGAELEFHSLLISALDKSGQPHIPAALLPGISASILHQQEAEGTLSQSGGLKKRQIC